MPGYLNAIRKHLFAVFLLSSIGIAIYANSLHVEFLFDDIPVILKNPFTRYLNDVPGLFLYDPTRFLTHLTFALNYHLHGPNPFYFHCFNLFIHIVSAVLVYYLVRLTLAASGRLHVHDEGEAYRISLFCSLIFLTHPIQTESVTYIVQRSTSLAGLLYFLALIFYLKLKTHFRWYYYCGAWVVVILGAMTKPIFITLPAIVLLYEFCFFDLSRDRLKKDFIIFLPYLFALILIPVFLTMFLLHYFSQTFDASKIFYATRLTSEISRLEYLLTQLRVLCTYIRLLFIPINQNLDYYYPLSHNLFEAKTLLSFLFLGAVAVYAVKMFKRRRLIFFALAWFFIVLIPESSIFPIQDIIFEHRLYVAVVGFAICLCVGLTFFVANKIRYTTYLSLIVLSLSMLTYTRNALWANPVGFYEDVVKKSPLKARPHNNLGLLYQKLGRPDSAESEYKKAIALDGKYLAAYSNLARLYADRKQYEEAARLYTMALSMDPEYYEANLNLGNLYYAVGKLDLADAQYRKAMSINPKSDSPYIGLGNVYLRFGNFGDAQRFIEQAVTNNPFSPSAHYALGILYFSQPAYDKAIAEFKQAISIDPDYIEAYNMLGIIYAKITNYPEAERCFRKTVELKPDYLTGYLNLANYYEKMGRPDVARAFLAGAAAIEKRQGPKPR